MKGLILLDVTQCVSDAIKHKGYDSIFFLGGGVLGNAEQHYVLFKELEPYLGLSLTLSGT